MRYYIVIKKTVRLTQGEKARRGGGGTNRLGDNSAAANRQIAANDERAC